MLFKSNRSLFRFGVPLLLYLILNTQLLFCIGQQSTKLFQLLSSSTPLPSTIISNFNKPNLSSVIIQNNNHRHRTPSPPSITSLSTIMSSINNIKNRHKYQNTSNHNAKTSIVQDRLFQIYTKKSKRAVGKWSNWSQWSPCSRTCGGGVSIQSRQCISATLAQDSRLNRGKRRKRQHKNVTQVLQNSECVGLYKRHQLCNDFPCPISSIDFRYQQCAKYNQRLFRGRKYFWEPYLYAINECELNCRPIGENFYAILNRTVIDGTKCTRPLTLDGQPASKFVVGICVEGKCRAIGPNGIIGLDPNISHHTDIHHQSQRHHTIYERHITTTATCSACTNTTKCIQMSFIFTQPQMTPGYTKIAVLPTGACNINITQLRPTRNHLALRNVNGTYALNGHWNIHRGGVFEAGGARFVYDNSMTSLESIASVGPLLYPLEIMLIYRVPNPGVKYEYKIAPSVATHQISSLTTTKTTTTTGADPEQIAPPLIDLRRLDRTPSADEAPNHHTTTTSASINRNIVQQTKARRKKYVWKQSPSSRTPCSRTCGGGGFQTAVLVCVREQTQTVVHDRRCAHSDKPDLMPIRCGVQPCPAHWISEWSPCSAVCSDTGENTVSGEQTLVSLECKQEINTKVTMVVNEDACVEPKPPLHRTCFVICNNNNSNIISNDLRGLKTAYWRFGPWSQCSASCGLGYRTRTVSCHGPDAHNECPLQQRPTSRERCEHLPPCQLRHDTQRHSQSVAVYRTSNQTSAWLYTEWSQNCEDDCGAGNQYRRVACLRDDSATCSADLKPETQRACTSDRHCVGKWYVGPWGRCIDPCGSSPIQKREILCIVHVKGQSRVVSERTCPLASKPSNERNCPREDINCVPQWYVSDWGACQSINGGCDNAVQRRQVRCLDRDQRDANNCDGDTPPVKRTCEPEHCLTRTSRTIITAGDQPIPDSHCIDKIERCRTAVQARLCQYEYYKTKCCYSCSRAPEIPRD